MKRFRDGLGALLALCLVVRVSAWLVRPALPLLGAVFFMVVLALFLLGWRQGS